MRRFEAIFAHVKVRRPPLRRGLLESRSLWYSAQWYSVRLCQ